MKKIITTPVLVTFIVTLLTGLLLGRLIVTDNHDVTCDKEQTVSSDLVKGGVYEKEFFKDCSDPFAQVKKDTIVILDLQQSKRKRAIYAKWTYLKWNDTTRFISSEVSYLSENTKRIK